jgi:hypothetical protein
MVEDEEENDLLFSDSPTQRSLFFPFGYWSKRSDEQRQGLTDGPC